MVRAKLKSVLSVLLLTFVLSLSGCAADIEKAPVRNVDAFFVVDDVAKAREDIEASGGRVVHIFPDDKVMIGEISKKFKSKHVDAIFYEGSKAKPSRGEVFYNAWTKNLEYKKLSVAEKMAMIGDDVPENPGMDVVEYIKNPLFEGKDYVYSGKYSTQEKSLPLGTLDPEDTSLYMAGDVSISVILPESDETSLNTETWTQEEMNAVYSEIMAGLDWWVNLNPNANLVFIHNWEYQVEIPNEPITMNGIDFWTLDTMTELGYPGSPLLLDGIYDYVNYQRNEKNTDWGFVVFVVDSSEDADGRFDGDSPFPGAFAFTRLQVNGGGPYVVMTYDNSWGYGIDNMDMVFAHELGHVFGALDQYGSCSCSDKAGYLNYENQNCDTGCFINEPSIMKSLEIAYLSGNVDEYARGQIGWANIDGDNILDIFEGNSYLGLSEYQPDPEQLDELDYFGFSTIPLVPAENNNYNDVLIDRVSDLSFTFSWDGGSTTWEPAVFSEGVFGGNSLITNYDFTALLPEWGTYLVEAQATNRFGEIYSDSDTVMYVGCIGGNLDPRQKGNVTSYDGAHHYEEDTCHREGRFYSVTQYYCDGYNIESTETLCYYGCNDGKCLRKYIPTKYKMMVALPEGELR